MLRFARVKRYRTDKSAAEADTIETVRAIYERMTGRAAPVRPERSPRRTALHAIEADDRQAQAMARGTAAAVYGRDVRRRHEVHGVARYNASMVTRDIRRFLSRDWAAARANKDAYWAERIARLGPAEGFRIADELRRQMMMQNPAWPDEESRHADLMSHVRLAALFHRAASTRRD